MFSSAQFETGFLRSCRTFFPRFWLENYLFSDNAPKPKQQHKNPSIEMQWATSNDSLNQLEYTDMRCAQTHSHTLTHSERRWRNVQNNTLNHLLRAYLPLFFACSLALLLPPCSSLSSSSSSSSLVSFLPFNCWINLSLCVISYALQHTLSQKLCYIPCDHRTDSNYRLLTESRARAHTIAFVNNSVVNCWYKESTHSQALFECNTQIILLLSYFNPW